MTGILPQREIVFISHATPEDNHFAIWLAIQLTNAGYKVWLDKEQLLGSEPFWDEIEHVLRHQTAKALFICSKVSMTKRGVQKEIQIAKEVRDEIQNPRFLYPLMIDNLPFDALPKVLKAQNAADCYNRWQDGLEDILKVLERDNIPKKETDSIETTGFWHHVLTRKARTLSEDAENLDSNWLSLKELPRHLNFYKVQGSGLDINQLVKIASEASWPCFELRGYIASFADMDSLAPGFHHLKLEPAFQISLQNFLQGEGPEEIQLQPKDARNKITGLLKKGWDNFLQSKGLKAYSLSSRTRNTAWWIPVGLVPDKKLSFRNAPSKRSGRKLIGMIGARSKRAVKVHYWHYGVSVAISLDAVPHSTMRHHVIITEDGKDRTISADAMHSKRRSFCSDWRNDKWRELLLSFLYWLSDGQQQISIPLGPEARMIVSADPIRMSINKSVLPPKNEPIMDDRDLIEQIPGQSIITEASA
ncbi:MAG: toll/interleukin-1 receptor domain-containing protein [Oligoflexales bacterium]